MDSHHQARSRPADAAPPPAASGATTVTTNSSGGAPQQDGSPSQHPPQHPPQQHRHDDHTLFVAAAAAVADRSSGIFKNYKNYQPASDAAPAQAGLSSASSSPVVTPSPVGQVNADTVLSATPDMLQDGSKTNKRPFTLAALVAAKRARIDCPAISVSVSPSPELSSSSVDAMVVTDVLQHTTSSAPSPSSPSQPSSQPSRTVYRRMRSKSLPDISMLTLHSSPEDWPNKKKPFRPHRHHNHSSHHHHHHRKSSRASSPSPVSAAPANAPPVNLQGLRELDLQEILKNPQLRHDIVFDPQLQFRPNLDGERGRRKKILADKYWDAVVVECNDLSAAYSMHHEAHVGRSGKLVGILSSLSEILASLLPVRDRAQVEEVLDIELQIQKLQHGAFDFVKLATWLSGIFKSHCAPMRDAWVDQMLQQITTGVEYNDSAKIVEGIRMVFTILEAMKLDVANHQIRTLRPLLVETAVEFEHDYFSQRVARCKVDVTTAVDWYKATQDFTAVRTGLSKPASAVEVFISGLISLFASSPSPVLANSSDEFPVTFAFDFSRLRSLKSDIAQIMCLQQCLTLYRQLFASCQPGAAPIQRDLDSLKAELLILVAAEEEASGTSITVNGLPYSVPTFEGATSITSNLRWQSSASSIAMQIARKVKQRFPTRGASFEQLAALAQNWLQAHLAPDRGSAVYKLIERRVLEDLERHVRICFSSPQLARSAVAVTNLEDWSSASRDVAPELSILASRICLLGDFHWNVFSSYYVGNVPSKATIAKSS
ncbi:T-complex protein 11-domain-containing protein [Limtongia smithiae]|uniref:T-complex protein 11-domain-containing protein n=1 Tax=Limtongia smithiae TaxID=1125753 RepID=UPI0034CEE2BD